MVPPLNYFTAYQDKIAYSADNFARRIEYWHLVVFIFAFVVATTLLIAIFRTPASIYELGASIGPFVEALVEHGRYRVDTVEYSVTAAKMPVLPLLYASLMTVTGSTIATLFIKNLIFSVMLVAFLFHYARQTDVRRSALVLALALMFCIPFNALTMLELRYEEAILSFLAPIAFGCALLPPRLWRSLVLALLIATIYLTKSSMVAFCLWLALMAAFDVRAMPRWRRAMPLAALVVAALAWGGFVDARTGQFAIGGAATSDNGWNLYKGNNPLLQEYYPARHLDELTQGFRAAAPPFASEWESHQYYSGLARNFIAENPEAVAENAIRKFYTLFIRIPDFEFNRNRFIKILVHDTGMILNRMLLWGAIFLALAWLVSPGQSRSRRWTGLLFLGGLAAFAAPYLVGFGYQRHMVPMFLSSILLLMQHDVFASRRTAAFSDTAEPHA